jgi:hypothetical protein
VKLLAAGAARLAQSTWSWRQSTSTEVQSRASTPTRTGGEVVVDSIEDNPHLSGRGTAAVTDWHPAPSALPPPGGVSTGSIRRSPR